MPHRGTRRAPPQPRSNERRRHAIHATRRPRPDASADVGADAPRHRRARDVRRARCARRRCRAAALGSRSRQRREQPREARRRRRGQRVPVRLARQHGRQRVGHVLALEQPPSRQHLVERRTPNAQMSARLSTGLPRACSGAHVGRRAEDHPRLRHRRRRDRRRLRHVRRSRAPTGSIAFARPKSSTFTVPSGRDLDVRGLQIAVDDALLVRRFQRLRDLLRDRQRFVERDRARARSAATGPRPRRVP